MDHTLFHFHRTTALTHSTHFSFCWNRFVHRFLVLQLCIALFSFIFRGHFTMSGNNAGTTTSSPSSTSRLTLLVPFVVVTVEGESHHDRILLLRSRMISLFRRTSWERWWISGHCYPQMSSIVAPLITAGRKRSATSTVLSHFVQFVSHTSHTPPYLTKVTLVPRHIWRLTNSPGEMSHSNKIEFSFSNKSLRAHRKWYFKYNN